MESYILSLFKYLIGSVCMLNIDKLLFEMDGVLNFTELSIIQTVCLSIHSAIRVGWKTYQSVGKLIISICQFHVNFRTLLKNV